MRKRRKRKKKRRRGRRRRNRKRRKNRRGRGGGGGIATKKSNKVPLLNPHVCKVCLWSTFDPPDLGLWPLLGGLGRVTP